MSDDGFTIFCLFSFVLACLGAGFFIWHKRVQAPMFLSLDDSPSQKKVPIDISFGPMSDSNKKRRKNACVNPRSDLSASNTLKGESSMFLKH